MTRSGKRGIRTNRTINLTTLLSFVKVRRPSIRDDIPLFINTSVSGTCELVVSQLLVQSVKVEQLLSSNPSKRSVGRITGNFRRYCIRQKLSLPVPPRRRENRCRPLPDRTVYNPWGSSYRLWTICRRSSRSNYMSISGE